MTALRELFLSRACKIALAVTLTASMVPVAALSASPAFAEDARTEQTARADELGSDANDGGAAEETVDELLEERAAYATEDGSDGSAGENAAAENSSETDADANGIATDVQIETLETTVNEPFTLFSPLRSLFGASEKFTAPLAAGNHTAWIDRLDLSDAPYARPFYDVLMEASDNDGTSDWLIDPGSPNVLNRANAKVGNVYRSPNNTRVIGILAAIVNGNEQTSSTSLTPTESKVREYVSEVYGAFDRDNPASFWRDVKFGTMFWRPADNSGRTYCLFVLQTSDMDIRAKGYRSAAEIQQAIVDVNEDVKKIKDAYKSSELSKKDSEYSRVKFYNDWICANNQYNTSFGTDQNLQENNPDVWSAVSALDGRKGADGPVCEGYSRAMKLLCDSDDIGCVLVDGNAPGAGPHMWNYVRVGNAWYGLDITWNNTGRPEDREQYFLCGSDTFLTRHPATNQFVANGTTFTNGPVLSASAYDPYDLSFAGIITSADSFSYGDSFALGHNSTVEGDVTFEVVSGPGKIDDETASTPARTAAVGAGPLFTVTGLGDITLRATLAPAEGQRAQLTDTITVKGVPRPLKVSGTELASKVYDGKTGATVKTAGQLTTARPDLSYASLGVLEGDSVSAKATSAAFDSSAAGASKTGEASYELVGDADALKLYTLSGNETDVTATGSITKRPATAYFALSSTRMLLNEEKPTGTVRYEAFTDIPSARGVLDSDDLALSGVTIELDGLPDPLTAGVHQVTWAKPNGYVLDAINKLPAASNYDIALAEGSADETVALEVVSPTNTVVIPAEGTSGAMSYRVEARVNGINNDTLDKLADSGFTSVEGITAKLIEALSNQTKNLDGSRIAVYDMTLFVQNARGAWVEATVENFPADGVRVTFGYPEGTAADKNSFYAAHMFTAAVSSGGAVHKPGEVETPRTTNTDNGVELTLMGFSPISLAWDDTPPTTQAGNNGNLGSGTSGSNGSSISGNTTQAGMSAANGNGAGAGLITTGDSILVIAVVAVVIIACVACIVFLLIRRKKDRRP